MINRIEPATQCPHCREPLAAGGWEHIIACAKLRQQEQDRKWEERKAAERGGIRGLLRTLRAAPDTKLERETEG